MGKVSEFLYGSEEFELVFDVPIEDAIGRLSSNVSKATFSRLAPERMVGHVSRQSVKIQRVKPMEKNSFKPFFVGSFSELGDKTSLSGVFRFHRAVQIFMTYWFGFNIFWIIIASAVALVEPSVEWFFPFGGLLMFCFGVGLVRLGKWQSRSDQGWLKKRIGHAINKGI